MLKKIPLHYCVRIVSIIGIMLGCPLVSVQASADTWTETDQYIYTTNSTKNVGIGTASPGADLTVAGSSFLLGGDVIDGIYEPEDRVFEIQAYDGAAYLNLKGKNGNFVLASTDYGEGSNGFYSSEWPLVFYTKGSSDSQAYERMRLTNEGNVGIGISNPSAKLQVASADGHNLVLSTTSTTGPGVTWGGGTSFQLRSTSTSDPEGSNKFVITNAGNGANLMTVNYDGNVGIGTTSPNPDAKLHINNASAGGQLWVDGNNGTYGLYLGADVNSPWIGSRTNHDLRIVTNNIEKMRLTAAGNVGIGTANPEVKLHLANAGQAQLDLQNTTTGGTPTSGSRWRVFADNVGGGGGNLTFGFYDVANVVMRGGFDNAGQFGIGTTAPGTKLDVNGGVNITQGLTFGSTTTPRLVYVYPMSSSTNHGDATVQGTIAYYVASMATTSGTIYLQPGTYYVSQPIGLPDNFALIGSGPSSIIQANSSLTADVINNEGTSSIGSTGVRNVALQNFKVVGNKASEQDCIDIGGDPDNYSQNVSLVNLNVELCGKNGIIVKHTNGLTMQNITLKDNGTSVYYDHNIYLNALTNVTVSNIYSSSAAGNGFNAVALDGASLNNIIARENGRRGIRLAGSKRVTLTGSSAIDNGQESSDDASGFVFVSDDDGNQNHDIMVTGCISYSNSSHGITISYGDRYVISGCSFKNNTLYGINNTGGVDIIVTSDIFDNNGSGTYTGLSGAVIANNIY